MAEASGLMNLAFPAVVSNTILRRLVGDWSRQRSHNPQTRQRIRNSLGQAMVGGALQLPPFRVLAREIEALDPGTVLRFPLPSSSLAEFRVAGVPLFRAAAVRRGEHRGAHLKSTHQ
jgi:flagellar motor switch protein FliM